MSIAISSKVVAIEDATAAVERLGEPLVVSTLLLPDPPERGHHVVVRARSRAVEKRGAAEAQESLALLRGWAGLAGDADGTCGNPDEVNG
jgi:hydrogenase maturation factor